MSETSEQKRRRRSSPHHDVPIDWKDGGVKVSPKKTKKKSRPLSTKKRNDLSDAKFAFPNERKEPLVDATHVRSAISRFDQVKGVSDKERDRAWKRIVTAAKKFDVEVSEGDWRELFQTKTKAKKPKKVEEANNEVRKAKKIRKDGDGSKGEKGTETKSSAKAKKVKN
jgi:hypothetical protein